MKRTVETFTFLKEDFVPSVNDRAPGVEVLQLLVEYLSDSYSLVREDSMNILLDIYNKYGNVI